MNQVIVPVAEFDSHDCKLGPEHGCPVCQAKAEFYRLSRQKWERLQAKWQAIRDNRNKIDCRIVAAIMTPDKEEEKQHANA